MKDNDLKPLCRAQRANRSGRTRSNHCARDNPTNYGSAAVGALVKSVRSSDQLPQRPSPQDAGYGNTTSLLDRSLQGSKSWSHLTPIHNHLSTSASHSTSQRTSLRMREACQQREKARYALRKSTVEPVFGQIKAARGIRRFRLRSLPR